MPSNGGELQTRSVIASPGYTEVVTIASAFSPDPVAGAVWQLIGSNLAPRRFRVLTSEEKEDGTYAVTALLYDPNKQARIEESILLSLPSVTSFQTGPIAAPMGTPSGGVATLARLTTQSRDQVGIVKRACARRASFYRSLRTFSAFGRGWLRRNARMEAIGVKMCLETTSASSPPPRMEGRCSRRRSER